MCRVLRLECEVYSKVWSVKCRVSKQICSSNLCWHWLDPRHATTRLHSRVQQDFTVQYWRKPHCREASFHCVVVFCSQLHCTVLHCSTLHCTVLLFTALHCIVLLFSALHCTVLLFTALHCTVLPFTALHCTALACSALYCTGPACTALPGGANN